MLGGLGLIYPVEIRAPDTSFFDTPLFLESFVKSFHARSCRIGWARVGHGRESWNSWERKSRPYWSGPTLPDGPSRLPHEETMVDDDKRQAALQEIADLMNSEGEEVVPRAFDVRSPGQIHQAIRFRFIRATGKTTPEVWEDLREHALPLYEAALSTVSEHERHTRLKGWLETWAAYGKPENITGAPLDLALVLEQWGQRWNLVPTAHSEQWCERYAIAALRFWLTHPTWAGPTPFSLSSPYIDPRPMAERPRTIHQLKAAKAHRIRKGRGEPSWEQFVEPKALHLQMLALYQCREMKLDDLHAMFEREYPKLQVNTVYQTVRRCAADLGLTLRARSHNSVSTKKT